LLRWLEVNYESDTNDCRRLENFNGIKNGLYLASTIKNYVGEFSFVNSALANMKPICNNIHDMYYNLRKVLKVLKLINLQVTMTKPEDFIQDGNQRELCLFV